MRFGSAKHRIEAAILTLALAAAGVAGCGGSSSDTSAVQQQVAQARQQGAEQAHQADRLKQVQGEVKNLQNRDSQAGTGATAGTASAAPADAGASGNRLFTAPSGNIRCEISDSGASCSVLSSDQTYNLPQSGSATSESGLTVAAGPVAGYGAVISAGSVTCQIPEEQSPSGITCRSDDGHGFEASRDVSRVSVY